MAPGYAFMANVFSPSNEEKAKKARAEQAMTLAQVAQTVTTHHVATQLAYHSA
jgi:hypothetical protein